MDTIHRIPSRYPLAAKGKLPSLPSISSSTLPAQVLLEFVRPVNRYDTRHVRTCPGFQAQVGLKAPSMDACSRC